MLRTRFRPIIVALVSVIAVGASAPVAGASQPQSITALLTQPRCTDASATVSVFRQGGIPLVDWRENLEFDGRGLMWVSHSTKGIVEAYDPDGELVKTVKVASPGGIRVGPDGYMYVNYGVPVALESGIMRFDPTSAHPVAEVVVDGLSGINGLAIDDDGSFYLGREASRGILKVTPDGTIDHDWTAAADVFGTNGVTIADGRLYATALTDLTSPVAEVPLREPDQHRTLARLSAVPNVYKALDDLEVSGDHLLVTAFATGELLRVRAEARARRACCSAVYGSRRAYESLSVSARSTVTVRCSSPRRPAESCGSRSRRAPREAPDRSFALNHHRRPTDKAAQEQ
ncbi:hypothetical protein FB381_2436 [Nocardioides albertanoniae]|uniref:SMP-30/gluconolaconase/LRE-like protein n=1 Tax=Nocardioides albertanoniae TaxID=1175486 RepID=A0A543A7G9_9ACTN|nr:hypothetical protein [Nocardioides albertanoniae]TQL68545.1 hypothetical protein FB381_2436 [Nocardioides albertanoniae]